MMPQLLAHLWGDYLLQSDWMAQNKRMSTWACWCHCWLYLLCFWPVLLLGSPAHIWHAGLAIFFSHFLIDRFGLARYLVWAKNWIGPVPQFAYEAGGLCQLPRWIRKGDAGILWKPAGGWKRMPWAACSKTGYPPSRPEWMTVWLLIIADNTLHLTCNYLALRWF